MRRIRRNKKRTVSDSAKSSAAVLFFVGLTVCYLFFHGRFSADGIKSSESNHTIVRESAAGREKIPLGEYLIGALAVSVPDDFAPEACKAQAVILRTNVEWMSGEEGSSEISYETLCQASLTREEMNEKWGDDYEKQYGRLKAAVEATEGQTLCYHGAPVELPFFPVSAGQTRDADEISGTKNFPYLKTVACGQDVFAADYRQETIVSEKEYQRLLQQLFETGEEIVWQEVALETDSAGYVKQAVWNGKTVSGETFREALSLASACFTIEEKEKELHIITKGVGHGLGMSLYTAGQMAAEGKDYQEILQYFFAECEIVKN
ncbi:SpoIID/LytB domain-containing protein [Lachnospiraceae bacterium JLR.KK008]